jgi:hypothetical protein
MSWFYRYFKKSDDDATVTLTSTNINLTGITTITGTATFTGALTAGNITAGGALLSTTHTATGAIVAGGQVTGAGLLSTSTVRSSTSPIYLGSGTVAIGFGAYLPGGVGQTGVTIDGSAAKNFGIGSLYINTTYGTMFVKTGHASTAWVTMYATPS